MYIHVFPHFSTTLYTCTYMYVHVCVHVYMYSHISPPHYIHVHVHRSCSCSRGVQWVWQWVHYWVCVEVSPLPPLLPLHSLLRDWQTQRLASLPQSGLSPAPPAAVSGGWEGGGEGGFMVTGWLKGSPTFKKCNRPKIYVVVM